MTRRVAHVAGSAAALALAAVVVCGGPLAAAAVLALVVAAAILAAWPTADRPVARGRAILALLLLPMVLQFHAAGGRINGDGVSYYVYVRSMVKDADLDFTNEYAHYGLLERADLAVPTRTGLRRSIFAVGPGLISIPFFAAGEVAARLASAVSAGVDLSGYGPHHVNAVALGSLLLGFGCVLLVHALAARHFAAPVALLAAASLLLATFLYWYMVQQPTMSHAPSAFGAALVVWWWDRHRDAGPLAPTEGVRARSLLLLGLLIGLAMCLRWQNALLALLPGFDLARRLRPAWKTSLRGGIALALGMIAGALPQMAAWKVIYGEWVLLYPPHGADFLRLDRPFVLETLFSSRHGLLWWTPVLWLGYLGLAPLLRSRPALALPLIAPAALMTYVNMCSGDWWAGGSFSNRRFDSLLPILALGMAASFEWLAAAIARRPSLVPAVLALGAAVAHVAAGEGMRARPVGPVAFAEVAGAGADALAGAAGSPPSWPASWIFAARRDRPPGQYDRLVGRYLFYRQNNLQGRVGMADDALLGEGWGALADREGREARQVATGRARVFAPLDVAEDIAIEVTAAAEPGGGVRVLVNGAPAGTFTAGPTWSVHRVTAARPAWRRDLNDVVLEAVGPARIWIAELQFLRVGAADGRERGFEAR